MTKTTEIAKREMTPSERFAASIERQFSGEVGQISMTEFDRTLAQHAFIRIDAAMIEAEKNRQYNSKSDPEIIWKNMNMRKLAIDVVNRIQLGLDALIPGQIYPIFYLNRKTGQYDVDLRVGYKGELYYVRRASIREIQDIRVELVYDTDKFTVYKKGVANKVEGYDLEITQPFDRGELMGGFVYIEYKDGIGNELVVMSRKDIEKIRNTAKSGKFWSDWFDEMAYKTLIHKAMRKIVIDPQKINVAAFASVNAEEPRDYAQADATAAIEADAEPLELPAEPATVEVESHSHAPVGESGEEPF